MEAGDSGAARHACGARQPTTRFEAQTARRKEGEKNKNWSRNRRGNSERRLIIRPMGAAFVQLRHLLVWLRDGPRPRPLLFAFQWERNTSALHTHAFLCGVGRLEVFDPVWLRIAEKMRRAVFLLKSCWFIIL